jgi:hypothetical protein
MDTAVEQRKQEHVQRLKAERVFEARRQEWQTHITPPSPVPTTGYPIPTLRRYLELLAFLGDSGPAPTDLLVVMERFEVLKTARPVRPQDLEDGVVPLHTSAQTQRYAADATPVA